MKPLTKSLHTVTAVVNVARHLAPSMPSAAPSEIVGRAMAVLGYTLTDYAVDDPTLAAIAKAYGRVAS